MRTILSVLLLLTMGCASMQPEFIPKLQGDCVNMAIQKKKTLEAEGGKAKIVLRILQYKDKEDVFASVKYKNKEDQLEDCVDRAIKIKQRKEAEGYEAQIIFGILKYSNGREEAHAVVDYECTDGKKRDYNY